MISRSSGRFLFPARAVCPLPPRPEVLPRLPPRPTIMVFIDFVFGTRLFSCIVVFVYFFSCMSGKFLESFDSCSRDVEFVLATREELAADILYTRMLNDVSYCTTSHNSTTSGWHEHNHGA